MKEITEFYGSIFNNVDLKDAYIRLSIVIIIALMLIIVVSALKRKYQKPAAKRVPVLPYLKGTKKFADISVDDSGDYIDTLLSKNRAIERILYSLKCGDELKILVFSEAITGIYDKKVERMMYILQTCSRLKTTIHYVNNSNYWDLHNICSYLSYNGLRADKIINSTKNTPISIFNDYHIVFHPNAGMSASYEILAGVIRGYKNDNSY